MSSNQGDHYGQGDAVPQNPPYDPYGPTGSFPAPPQQGYGPGPGYGYGQQPMPPGYYGPPMIQQKTNGMAVTGMVLGIISLVFFWASIFGIIIAILAVIFSGVGMSQCTRTGQGGKGMAIAGLTCGLIAIGLFVMVIAVVSSVLAHASM